jgi:hypothetical protein
MTDSPSRCGLADSHFEQPGGTLIPALRRPNNWPDPSWLGSFLQLQKKLLPARCKTLWVHARWRPVTQSPSTSSLREEQVDGESEEAAGEEGCEKKVQACSETGRKEEIVKAVIEAEG